MLFATAAAWRGSHSLCMRQRVEIQGSRCGYQRRKTLAAHAAEPSGEAQCANLGELFCPASVPLAIRAPLKAGSRAAGLWAASGKRCWGGRAVGTHAGIAFGL